MAQIEELAEDKNVAANEEKPEEEKSLSSKTFSFIKELVILVATAFVLAFIFKTFIVQPFKVDMSSMMPTIEPNHRLFVNKFTYRFNKPKTGDIITFYSNESILNPGFSLDNLFSSSRRILIKRVMAAEGQTIEIINGQVYVDNKPVKEPYVKFKDFSGYGPLSIPKGKVFVMGDNRPNSKDSRTFGPVNKSEILGKAFFVYWPLSAIKTL